jgi:hypothetical protein
MSMIAKSRVTTRSAWIESRNNAANGNSDLTLKYIVDLNIVDLNLRENK